MTRDVPLRRWTRILSRTRTVFFCAFSYWLFTLVVMGIGFTNGCRYRSSTFQIGRTSKLLEFAGRPPSESVVAATLLLVPAGAQRPFWTYETFDDSWLSAEAVLRWRTVSDFHEARWQLRYCIDPLWGEHFVDAAAVNDEARALTPALARHNPNGRPVQTGPGSHPLCFVY
jgi:hypothetical protein